MIWYDIYDMIWCDMMWYDIIYDIWYDMIWYDMIYDMIWYDMIWYDMIWYDMIENLHISSDSHSRYTLLLYLAWKWKPPYVHVSTHMKRELDFVSCVTT